MGQRCRLVQKPSEGNNLSGVLVKKTLVKCFSLIKSLEIFAVEDLPTPGNSGLLPCKLVELRRFARGGHVPFSRGSDEDLGNSGQRIAAGSEVPVLPLTRVEEDESGDGGSGGGPEANGPPPGVLEVGQNGVRNQGTSVQSKVEVGEEHDFRVPLDRVVVVELVRTESGDRRLVTSVSEGDQVDRRVEDRASEDCGGLTLDYLVPAVCRFHQEEPGSQREENKPLSKNRDFTEAVDF